MASKLLADKALVVEAKSFVAGMGWVDWLALATVLFLIVLLVWLVWRRRQAGGQPLVPASAPKLPVNRLRQVWRTYANGIPWSLRREALGEPLFLVLGEAGSGKTGVIDRHTNWQGQKYRFYPSATQDPLMQIYQGSKALVVELSSALLYDNSREAFRALSRLWKEFPDTPNVVLAIDVQTLLAPESERLRQTGQAVLGKLEVFAGFNNQYLPLTLGLTHMESVEGYAEFCSCAEEIGLPLRFDFPEGDGLQRMARCLDDLGVYLSHALLSRSAQDYLKIVRFLDVAPRVLEAFADALRLAGFGQEDGPAPIVRLCLLSQLTSSPGANPFVALPDAEDERKPFKLNVHAKVALAMTLTGCVYLFGSYYYQQDMLSDILKRLNIVSVTPIERYPEKVSPLFKEFNSNLAKMPLLELMPEYFSGVDQYVKLRLIRDIRKYYIFPVLRRVQSDFDAPFKTNNILAWLYATKDNEIGRALLENIWLVEQDELYGKRILVQDYIANNLNTEELDAILNGFDFTRPVQDVQSNAPWLFLFRDLRVMLQKPYIREADLRMLQQRAEELLHIVNRVQHYQRQTEIVHWLEKHTSLRRAVETEYYSQSQLRQDGISVVLNMVKYTSFTESEFCPSNAALTECLNRIQAIASAKPVSLEHGVASFVLDGENFTFDGAQWAELIKRSRITALLRNIVYQHRNYDGWVFFDSPSPYPDLEMNSTNEGGAPFAGKGHIDGRLTADAFQRNVKPALLALDDIIAKLPVDDQEKKDFSNFVAGNLRTYADRYGSAYQTYFHQLQVNVDSTWALKSVLNQLQMPNSPLFQVLLQIKENTGLQLPANPIFQVFSERLSAFRFIQRLMQEQNGTYPEYAKFQAIMQQMLDDLVTRDPYQPKKIDADGAFKVALTPLGRMAWAISLNEDGNYSRQLKAWLANSGLTDSWQQPFVAPVRKAAELGIGEIKQTVDAVWADLWNSSVQPLLMKFPFDRTAGADREVNPEELAKVLHPKQGTFWVTFNQYLAPLCDLSNGVWVKRTDMTDAISLPDDLLRRANAAQLLTTSLWDAQGNPKAYVLMAKAEPLPAFDRKKIPDAPLVSLGYLRGGGASVMSFNQQPTWQKMALEWWTAGSAGVGMEFLKDADVVKNYADLAVGDGSWSLLRLLQKGQKTGDNRYGWMLGHPDFPQQKLTLQFTFKTDPWAIFAHLGGS